MKKLLNNPWFVGVLALAAVVFVTRSLIPARAGAFIAESAASGDMESGDQAAAPVTAGASSIQEALKEIAITSSVRDPFSPRAKVAAVQIMAEKTPPPDIVETLQLTALWTQNGATYALINDRIQCVGDKVGSLIVENATQEGVWIRHWKGRDFLTLGASFTLTTPAVKAAALTLSTEG